MECKVATISQKLFSLNDTYGVEILNEEDELYAVMLVLAIDAIKANQAAASAASH